VGQGDLVQFPALEDGAVSSQMAKFNGFSSSGKTHDEFVENERSPLTPQQEQQDQIRRLSRLAGQIGGIARMIEEGRSTADILMQTKAVRSALNVVEERVVQSALRDGIQRALDLGDRETVARALESLFALEIEQVRRRRLQPTPLAESL